MIFEENQLRRHDISRDKIVNKNTVNFGCLLVAPTTHLCHTVGVSVVACYLAVLACVPKGNRESCSNN
jgi:hypothetical protein